MKNILRWILFIPTYLIVFAVVCWVGYYGPLGYYAMFGPSPSGIIPFLWAVFVRDVCAVALAIIASCYVAPRGRAVIAACYVAHRIFLLGMFVATYILDPTQYENPVDTWATAIVSTITAIVTFVYIAYGKQLGWVKDNNTRTRFPFGNVVPFRKKEDDSIG